MLAGEPPYLSAVNATVYWHGKFTPAAGASELVRLLEDALA